MSPWMIYLWLHADVVVNFIRPFVGITASLSIILLLIRSVAKRTQDSDAKIFVQATKGVAKLAWVFIFMLPVAVAMPDTKTIAAMYVIPKITESDIIKKDLPEIYDLAISKLKAELEESEAAE